MKKGALAIRYAQALFDAAEEQGVTAEIYDELNVLSSELESNSGFRQFLLAIFSTLFLIKTGNILSLKQLPH